MAAVSSPETDREPASEEASRASARMLGAPSSFWAKLISHSVPNSRGDRGLSQAESSRAYEHCGPTFETAAGVLSRYDGENKVETKEGEQEQERRDEYDECVQQ